MQEGLGSLGCGDCAGTCEGDKPFSLSGLGLDCSALANADMNPATAQGSANYKAWQDCANTPNVPNAGSGPTLQTFNGTCGQPSSSTFAGWLSLNDAVAWSSKCQAVPIVAPANHNCPPGMEWDGINGLGFLEGLGDLAGCKPTQATLNAQTAALAQQMADAKAERDRQAAAQKTATDAALAKQAADQLAAQQAASAKVAADKLYADKVTAAKAACGAGYEWDGVLNGLNGLMGCKAIVGYVPPVVPVVTVPAVTSTVAQSFDIGSFLSGTTFGIPTWMLVAGAAVFAGKELSQ